MDSERKPSPAAADTPPSQAGEACATEQEFLKRMREFEDIFRVFHEGETQGEEEPVLEDPLLKIRARRGLGQYILDENDEPKLVDTLLWAKWLEENNDKRRVAHTTLPWGTRISTVFLGLDHGFGLLDEGEKDYKPVLWESMCFPWYEGGRAVDRDCERYISKQDALLGHRRLVWRAIWDDIRTFPVIVWQALMQQSVKQVRKALEKFRR